MPVDYTSDIFDALDVQDELQTLYTSGTVFHGFLGEKLPDWKAAASLVRKIAENYKLPYYTISPTYSVCREHGYLSGEHFTCPKCGKKAEVYSRITGYYRPVQNWNDGKTQEYKNRKLYDGAAAGKWHPVSAESSMESQPAVARTALKEPSEQEVQRYDELKPVQTTMVTMHKDDVRVEPMVSHRYLFTTRTCPSCRAAKKMLEGQELEIIDAEQNPELVREYGIMQAPTLVVIEGDSQKKYVNASNIKKYVDEELSL
jgi:ribonucleoside-triphosphate reductase